MSNPFFCFEKRLKNQQKKIFIKDKKNLPDPDLNRGPCQRRKTARLGKMQHQNDEKKCRKNAKNAGKMRKCKKCGKCGKRLKKKYAKIMRKYVELCGIMWNNTKCGMWHNAE